MKKTSKFLLCLTLCLASYGFIFYLTDKSVSPEETLFPNDSLTDESVSPEETLFPNDSLTVENVSPEETLFPNDTLSDESVSPEETLSSETLFLSNQEEGGEFELPLWGAWGFLGENSHLFDQPFGTALELLPSGTGFLILQEEGDFWKIQVEDRLGWVKHQSCFVNLPDLMPSILYDNPYADLCDSRSLGKEIPNVTGFRLYEALFYNQRLDQQVYTTPVLYSMAKKIKTAQEIAISQGYSLYIYECYRPYEVQTRLVNGLAELMSADWEVNQALTASPWNKAWFVSTGISTHQKGFAVDLSLVSVTKWEERRAGDYIYTGVAEFKELNMPTPFDELSPRAAAFAYPVSGSNWNGTPLASTMTPDAILLQNICTEAGMVPLASEWWHFTDSNGGGANMTGGFIPLDCHGIPPLEENSR